MPSFIATSSLAAPGPTAPAGETGPQPRPPGAGTAEPGRRRLLGPHQLDPVVQGKLALDQPSERRGHGGFEAGTLDRVREQTNRLERLDGLPQPPGDLVGGHPL